MSLSQQQLQLIEHPLLIEITRNIKKLRRQYNTMSPSEAIDITTTHSYVSFDVRVNTLKHRLTRTRYSNVDHLPELLAIHKGLEDVSRKWNHIYEMTHPTNTFTHPSQPHRFRRNSNFQPRRRF